jgi:hypothetical protein
VPGERHRSAPRCWAASSAHVLRRGYDNLLSFASDAALDHAMQKMGRYVPPFHSLCGNGHRRLVTAGEKVNKHAGTRLGPQPAAEWA